MKGNRRLPNWASIRRALKVEAVRRPGTGPIWPDLFLAGGLVVFGLLISRMAQAQRWTDMWLLIAATLAVLVGTTPLRWRNHFPRQPETNSYGDTR
jgi:hypothetical protein